MAVKNQIIQDRRILEQAIEVLRERRGFNADRADEAIRALRAVPNGPRISRLRG